MSIDDLIPVHKIIKNEMIIYKQPKETKIIFYFSYKKGVGSWGI